MAEPIPSLVLRIDGATEPIAGELRQPDGPPRSFHGWLELVGLIENWRAEQRELAQGFAGRGEAGPSAADEAGGAAARPRR
jgi:hypothetical protein